VVRPIAFVLCLLPILAGIGLWIGEGRDVEVGGSPAALAIVLASGGWALALVLARGLEDHSALSIAVTAGALAIRIPLLAADLRLSDDSYRYAWEGSLVASGIDPYRHPPSSPELAHARARWPSLYAGVNHPEVPAAYPPLALFLQAGVVTLAGGLEVPERGLGGLRLFHSAADFLVCVPLLVLLRRRGLPSALAVAWAWNPWVALELTGVGHVDAPAILCLVAALACSGAGRSGGSSRSAAALGLAALGAGIKLLPLALVPFLLREARDRRRALLGLAVGLGLATLPFVLLTGRLPGRGGLGEYIFRWESFNLGYRGLEALFARSFAYDEGLLDPRRLARVVVGLAWLALAGLAWRRRLAPPEAAAVLVAGFLVLTPTLHPWYLAWIAPFLALRSERAFVFLMAIAPLLYLPLAGWRTRGVWEEPAALFPLVAVPFFGLLLWDRWRSLGAGRTG
jgi:hypothetical protein